MLSLLARHNRPSCARSGVMQRVIIDFLCLPGAQRPCSCSPMAMLLPRTRHAHTLAEPRVARNFVIFLPRPQPRLAPPCCSSTASTATQGCNFFIVPGFNRTPLRGSGDTAHHSFFPQPQLVGVAGSARHKSVARSASTTVLSEAALLPARWRASSCRPKLGGALKTSHPPPRPRPSAQARRSNGGAPRRPRVATFTLVFSLRRKLKRSAVPARLPVVPKDLHFPSLQLDRYPPCAANKLAAVIWNVAPRLPYLGHLDRQLAGVVCRLDG